MSGPIQIFTYGQPTTQLSLNPAAGFNVSFNGLDLGMDIGAKGGWPTGGEPLPLMSNGYAGSTNPWGDASSPSVAPFIVAASSMGTAGYYLSSSNTYNYQGGDGGAVDAQFFAAQLNVTSQASTPAGLGLVWEPAGGWRWRVCGRLLARYRLLDPDPNRGSSKQLVK